MGKWRKRHWIESKAIEAARFADKMEADDIAFQSYVYNLRRIGLTPYDIHDTVSSFAIPSQFLSDGKQLFIFDKDAADMIGKTSGLPDLREVLKSVPYKTFAVDLGNEKGFYFVSGEVSKDKTVASEYGVDQRDDKYMVDRPTFYETENGQKIGFNWTPVSKNNDDDGPDLRIASEGRPDRLAGSAARISRRVRRSIAGIRVRYADNGIYQERHRARRLAFTAFSLQE